MSQPERLTRIQELGTTVANVAEVTGLPKSAVSKLINGYQLKGYATNLAAIDALLDRWAEQGVPDAYRRERKPMAFKSDMEQRYTHDQNRITDLLTRVATLTERLTELEACESQVMSLSAELEETHARAEAAAKRVDELSGIASIQDVDAISRLDVIGELDKILVVLKDKKARRTEVQAYRDQLSQQ
jgi:hypothetical protein